MKAAIKSLLPGSHSIDWPLPRGHSNDYKSFSKKTKETEKEMPKVQSYDDTLPTASLSGRRVQSWNGELEEEIEVVFENTESEREKTPKVKKKKTELGKRPNESGLVKSTSLDARLSEIRNGEEFSSKLNQKALEIEEKLHNAIQDFNFEKKLTEEQCKLLKKHFTKSVKTNVEKEAFLKTLARLSSIEQEEISSKEEVSSQPSRKSLAVDKKFAAALHKIKNEPEEKLTRKECELLLNSVEKWGPTIEEISKLKNILEGLSSPKPSKKVLAEEKKVSDAMKKFNDGQALTKEECGLLMKHIDEFKHANREERNRRLNTLRQMFWRSSI